MEKNTREGCVFDHVKPDMIGNVLCRLDLNREIVEVDWLALPSKILSIVAEKLLDGKDYACFGAVCSSWRTVYMDHKNLQEPLLLMLPTPHDQDHGKQTRSLYGFRGKRFLSSSVSIPDSDFCRGSSHGWVVTVSQDYAVRLINPLLSRNNEIVLPPLTAFRRVRYEVIYNVTFFAKVVLSADPLSNPSYVVMAIHGCYRRLSFFKPGNKSWTPVDPSLQPVDDVIYDNGMFYAIHNGGEVYACDVNGAFARVSNITPSPGYEYWGERLYIVKSGADLLQITRNRDQVGEPYRYRTANFIVLKFNPTVTSWTEVKSLDGRTLFLGGSSSLSLADIPGIKPNCIYFTDDYHNNIFPNPGVGLHDIGVFSMEDGSIESRFPVESKISVRDPVMIHSTLKNGFC